MNPKVSVIMPIYNAEKYVKGTIECILTQTFEDFELILINDHPTDLTLDIVRSIKDDRIRIIDNDKNRGIAYSRNRGLKEAKGEYIALMDDDDLSPNYRFKFEVEYLDEHPEIAAIGGGFRIIDENNEFVSGVTPTLQNPNYVKAQLMFYCTMYNGSTMFRRNIVEKHNILYKDDCLGMEDYRFWVEYSLYGKMTNTTDALLYWRQAPTTETIKVLNNKEKEREVVFAGIQRYAIESNGFKLTEREIEVFTNSFMELKVKQENKESLKELFEVLKKMIVQAREMGKENANEIMYACRNRFLEKLKKADIWY